MIPLVAASERGGAQTFQAYELTGAAWRGLDERDGGGSRPLAWVSVESGTPLERAAGAGESPVHKTTLTEVIMDREYRRTREIRREAGRTTAQG